jgi:hypothetical protein
MTGCCFGADGNGATDTSDDGEEVLSVTLLLQATDAKHSMLEGHSDD